MGLKEESQGYRGGPSQHWILIRGDHSGRNRIDHNLIHSVDKIVRLHSPPEGWIWEGNIAFHPNGRRDSDISLKALSMQWLDPLLERVGRIWRPSRKSPLVGAAKPGYPFVTHDIDGRLRAHAVPRRLEAKAVGVGERSEERDGGPLTPSDVGPAANLR